MKKTVICIVIIIALVLLWSPFRFIKYYSDACDTYSQNGIKGELSKEINNTIARELNDNVHSQELTNINYLPNGEISAITVNTSYINTLANQLSYKVYSCIKNTKTEFGVPLGNALGSRLFSGKGPKIGIGVVPTSAVTYEINSELISGGINQTLHRVYIVFTAEVNCIAPFYDSESKITNSVLICETLIVGKVPEVIVPRY